MDSNLLDYIILALVFAVVIHIFIQTFGKCNKTEGMGAPLSSIYTEDRPYNLSYGSPTTNLFGNAPIDARSEASSQASSQAPSQVQQFGASQGNQTNYIKQFVLNAGRVCPDDAAKVVNTEQKQGAVQNYQNNFFSFGEQINQSTREGITEVDRINEMQTAKNNELNRCNGQKISDVYDSLVKNDCEQIKQCKNPGCVIQPTIDQMSQTTTYTKPFANGNAFSRYDVMFETDGVNNGGKFYDDIEAFDNMSEYNLTL
jgi:hypothetical protein